MAKSYRMTKPTKRRGAIKPIFPLNTAPPALFLLEVHDAKMTAPIFYQKRLFLRHPLTKLILRVALIDVLINPSLTW